MTVYILTPEQHAQIVEAAESNAEYTEAEYLERREFWGEALDYRWKNLQAASEQAKATLAMLKAMQPVEPSLFSVTYGGAHTNNFHRVKENADDEMQRLERNFPEPVNKRKVAALYTPTKD